MVETSDTQNGLEGLEQRLREVERLLEEKESLLREKDKTVKTLTQRLEQTVERLDRVQRVGSDRSVQATAAFPKEVVEQQTELVQELQRAVQGWEELRLASGLGRFELQLTELRERLDDYFRPPQEEPEESELSAEEPGEGQEPAESDASEATSPDALDEGESCAWFNDTLPIALPEILNLAEAREDALERVVREQDSFIDNLTARLRRAADQQSNVNWSELAGVPKKLVDQLVHTSAQLQQSRHLAEFELALQRTRLERQEADLQTLSTQLEERMTVRKREDLDDGEDSANGRRWLRMLGLGKTED